MRSKLKNTLPGRILHWLSWATLPLFPLLCLYEMDLMNFGGKPERVRSFMEAFPGPLRFEITVILLLGALLFLLLRRAWLAAGVMGALSLICGYVNYMKLALNGNYFVPQDIAMLAHARQLAGFISGGLPGVFWNAAAAMAAWVALLFIFGGALPGKGWKTWLRLGLAAVLAFFMWLPLSDIDRADAVLNRYDMSLFDSALQSSNYTANGFLGAFTVNLMSLNVNPPPGYSEARVREYLAGYEDAPAQDGAEQFDVIVILSESFFDPRILPGVTFSENPLERYDRLLSSPRCFSGSLCTTAFGGGTVRPEFSVLTGLTTDYVPSVPTPYRYVSRPLSTYVSNYRDAGYYTVAVHPYNKHFYSRDLAYGYLGFDDFFGQDEVASTVTATYKRGYITDETAGEVIRVYADRSDRPVFLMAITMQNHQPFSGIDPALMQVEVSSDRLSQPAMTALTTYVQGLCDADKMLGTLADWIDAREKPTVLVFFGDHLPTLGPNALAYRECGLFDETDGADTQELLKKYTTPFLIYSNRDLDLGLLPARTGSAISDYHLLNSVALSTGFGRTAYMRLLEDFYRVTPYYNVAMGMEANGKIGHFADAMKYLTYDRVFGRGYTG